MEFRLRNRGDLQGSSKLNIKIKIILIPFKLNN